ncbi:MAG TPA: FecR domain-containing protein [Povalibacter sp.]|uniref:FecR domain-containing protein n=1 Tax=Povalibacter sp. TaxID=1962978 RepID=UPI002C0A7D7E|nr:FecR domain-containing protein [Povalibacter sp.]HMN43775.1 FecR domain-containing protein [Povalibacter sp.]
MSAALPVLDTTLPRAVLEAAADWHVKLRFDEVSQRAQVESALATWLAENEQHRLAWSLVQRMEQRLGLLPQGTSQSVLTESHERRLHRRTVLKSLLLLAGGAGVGWSAYEQMPWRSWVAGHRSAVGERRHLALADGSGIDLNTATALDVHYDARQRLLRLHEGEILVQTAVDEISDPPRPFIVDTPQGRVRALGTRFSVRVDKGVSRVAVFEHAVVVSTRTSGGTVRLDAGEAVTFTRTSIASKQAADSVEVAWTRGMLVAVDQRLDDFLNELSRYRRDRIGCDPAVAGLHVTGTYRIDDTDHVLQSLTLSHPVRIHPSLFSTRVIARR